MDPNVASDFMKQIRINIEEVCPGCLEKCPSKHICYSYLHPEFKPSLADTITREIRRKKLWKYCFGYLRTLSIDKLRYTLDGPLRCVFSETTTILTLPKNIIISICDELNDSDKILTHLLLPHYDSDWYKKQKDAVKSKKKKIKFQVQIQYPYFAKKMFQMARHILVAKTGVVGVVVGFGFRLRYKEYAVYSEGTFRTQEEAEQRGKEAEGIVNNLRSPLKRFKLTVEQWTLKFPSKNIMVQAGVPGKCGYGFNIYFYSGLGFPPITEIRSHGVYESEDEAKDAAEKLRNQLNEEQPNFTFEIVIEKRYLNLHEFLELVSVPMEIKS